MKFDVVRAWKDAIHRKSLGSEELATLPECPADELELTDADLEAVQGAQSPSGIEIPVLTDQKGNPILVVLPGSR